jgi:ferredoxin
MRVQVDHDLCIGFGVCNDNLPEVFDLDEYGFSRPRADGAVPRPLEARARDAVATCPARAISEVGRVDDDG